MRDNDSIILEETYKRLYNKTQKIKKLKLEHDMDDEHENENNSTSWEDDAIDGKYFGHPGLFYNVYLNANVITIDDSDYNRETGYGHSEYKQITDINEFTISEYRISETDNIRNENDILSTDPKLYHELLDHAKNNIKGQG